MSEVIGGNNNYTVGSVKSSDVASARSSVSVACSNLCIHLNLMRCGV